MRILNVFKRGILPLSLVMVMVGCSGGDGDSGSNGFSALVNIVAESPGLNCTEGGQKISVGNDVDGDNVLSASEVTSSSYICNGTAGSVGATGTTGTIGATGEMGADGATGSVGAVGATGLDGSNAVNALVDISIEPSGDNCPEGGQKINVGYDLNSSGVLDESEITTTSYVCNGLVGETGANGEDGVDGRNGRNGADGSDGLNALVVVMEEPAGENCSDGGQWFRSGSDVNDDGFLDAEEIQSSSYICNGATGTDSLVAVSSEPAGANCTDGGQKIEVGQDSDSSGALDDVEVTSTSYVCNGATGPQGEPGKTSLIRMTWAGYIPGCNGGILWEAGIDDNRNGILEYTEVDSSQLVCEDI